jgi:hypothetical protein
VTLPTSLDPVLSSRAKIAEPSLPEVHSSVGISRSPVSLAPAAGLSGAGILISVGYMDPGNWATDIAGGSQFGYTLSVGHHDFEPDGDSAAEPEPEAGRGHGAGPGAALPRELRPLG